MDLRPQFSPSGLRISITSNRDGNYEIYVMDSDGGNVQQVTSHPERDDYSVWHPDGKQLLMVSERNGYHDLYLVDAPP
jgi:Tol biopolymer transport system component